MLKMIIPSHEDYDEVNEEFVTSKEQVLQLEHSLVSLSKWESKWCKPFLTKDDKTFEESVDYIKCMTLTQNVNPDVYRFITRENVAQVGTYIELPMTATIFSNDKKTINREVVTAEILYYWMISMNIPFECQKWHLNRLVTLINVCYIKNQPSKKMNKREIMNRNKALNDARRKALNTKG
jgi:hypothetical protein